MGLWHKNISLKRQKQVLMPEGSWHQAGEIEKKMLSG
jgi:hypothetical protein